MGQKDVLSFFDGLAPTWDAGMVRNDRIIGEILDAAEIAKGCSVLDVGCGTGVLFPDYLARDVGRLTGVDLSPAMISLAQKKFQDPRVELICGDAETIALPPLFDRCVIYNAFPHFFHPESLIRHLAGALVPGGRLTIAHGMSRAAIDAHHGGKAGAVSIPLMDPEALAGLMRRYFSVDTMVSDHEKYMVSGTKQGASR